MDRRRRLLATVHVAKKELGLDDDTYRDVLGGFGVSSAAELPEAGLAALIGHFEEKGFVVRSKRGAGRPKSMAGAQSRARLLQKIEALLTVGGKSWAYADGMARRMYRVDKVQWLLPEQLIGVVTALTKQGVRAGWPIQQ